MDPTVFLVGFAIMSVSSLALYAKGSKQPEIRHHTYFHAVVPFIAATAYLAMWFGVGDITTPDGVTTLSARYVDWTITTPILLTGLVTLGLHERDRSAGFIVSTIMLDGLMIVTGLISALSTTSGAKLAWFLWSCAAFAGVLYNLWVPIRSINTAESGPMASAYTKNLTFLSVIWFLYPIVFAIGPEGLKSITALASAWAILVLDVVAKVIYAFSSASNIEKAEQEKAGTVRSAR